MRSGLAAWNKAGGRVVAGLARRRAREADLILDGRRDSAASSLVVLRRGDAGEAVRRLQGDLIRLGVLAGAADGAFGPATEDAVRAFQAAHPQLVVDGVAGPATTAQIARVLAARTALATATAGGALATGGVVATGGPTPGADGAMPADGVIAAGFVLLCLALLIAIAWRYRDEICAYVSLKRRS